MASPPPSLPRDPAGVNEFAGQGAQCVYIIHDFAAWLSSRVLAPSCKTAMSLNVPLMGKSSSSTTPAAAPPTTGMDKRRHRSAATRTLLFARNASECMSCVSTKDGTATKPLLVVPRRRVANEMYRTLNNDDDDTDENEAR
jgi:hypothetical protein